MKQFLQKIKPNKLNIVFTAIIAILIAGSNFFYDSYSIDRISITIYLIFSIIIAAIFNTSLFKRFNILFSVLFFIGLYAFCQSFFSPYIDTNFEKLQQHFVALSFMLYILYYFVHKETPYSLKNFLDLALTLTYIIFATLLIDYAINSSTNSDYSFTTSILKYFKNIRVLNHLQTIIIPTLVLYMHIEKRPLLNKVIAAAIAINTIAVIYTGARGTAYAVETTLLLLLVSNFKNIQVRNNIFKTHLLFITAALFYVAVSSSITNANSLHITDISSNGRMHIYTTTLPYLIDKSYILNAIGFSSQDLAVTHFLHPHNILLYIFLGTGTLGLLVFVVYLAIVAKKMLTYYFKSDEVTDRYLLGVFAAAFIHSLVSGLYVTPLTAMLFIYFLLVFTKRYELSIFHQTENQKTNTDHQYFNCCGNNNYNSFSFEGKFRA